MQAEPVPPPAPAHRLHPLLSCLIFVVIWQVASNIVGAIPLGAWIALHLQETVDALRGADPQAAFQELLGKHGDLMMLGSALAAAPTFGVVLLCRKAIDQRPWADLGLAFKGRHLALGFAAGALAVLGLFGALALTGDLRVLGVTADPPVARAAGLLGLVFLQSGTEELVCRGYLLRTLMGRYRPTTAVALVSLFFAALHLMNPDASAMSFLQTALIGVLFSLVCLRTNGLWWAIGLHAAWNYTLAVVASLPVSGVTLSHLLDVEVVGPPWLTGGSYGLEASVLTLALVTGGCAAAAVALARSARAPVPAPAAVPAAPQP